MVGDIIRPVCFFLVLAVCVGAMIGCATTRHIPQNQNNLCRLFEEKDNWFKYADKAAKRWGIPIPVMMAIMHQESRFNPKAKPPRTTCLCFLPGPRPSSAYGFAQALDSTWERYQAATNNWGADRDDFADAVDFVGWYCYQTRIKCGVPANDAYGHYLAYHEGQTGFLRKTYRNKGWLLNVAGRVQRQSVTYTRQLATCEQKLRDAMKCFLWPF
ncbi:MAG: transglycosylase SLT domain-containing protein [Thermodesulfobacteriota bacterium]|nr:transglycosylase SLT domain-containing protein [Thermodesulfobacteriota bacterium]